MGYRIDFAVRDDLLRAVVSGKAGSDEMAENIGLDIAEQAKREARTQLLIDMRRLGNRIGSLGKILLPSGWRRQTDYRVAVIDLKQHDPHYVFPRLPFKVRRVRRRRRSPPPRLRLVALVHSHRTSGPSTAIIRSHIDKRA